MPAITNESSKEILGFIDYYLDNLILVASWVDPKVITHELLRDSYQGMIKISCGKLRELIDYYSTSIVVK